MFAAGASRPWEKAGGRYKYLFLNKLGCEATFSPDLNPCHLDSCLVGGDNEAGLDSHESMSGLVTAGDLVYPPPASRLPGQD